MTKRKSPAQIKEQLDRGYVCLAPGCCEAVTIFKGIGEDYCRHHQMHLTENGGLARADRPYTFHKKWCCDWCGYNPKEDPRFDRIQDSVRRDRGQRATLICDHIVRQADAIAMGWTDDQINGPDNIQTLCQLCEKVKSAENDDWNKNVRLDSSDS
jgi:hypothetical protein